MAIVYILYSKKLNRYYTGFTTDLDVRLSVHADAESRKFTSKSDDWTIYLRILCASKAQGVAIEKHIKRMKSKVYIENLMRYLEIIEKLKLYYDC